jgi:hypothetical protein
VVPQQGSWYFLFYSYPLWYIKGGFVIVFVATVWFLHVYGKSVRCKWQSKPLPLTKIAFSGNI